MATSRKARYTEADKQRFAEQRQAELDAMHDRLVVGVSSLVDGEQWRAWLRVAAKFRTYSFNNTILLFQQRPDATRVAGYKTWQSLGRQVNKGETGIRIFAPVTRRVEKSDRNGRPVVDAQGNPVTAVQMVGVKPTSVFDISQTSGEPLMEQPRGERLTGQAPEGLWDALTRFAESRGYTVSRGPLQGQVDGITRFADKSITVRPDVHDAHATATLIHELGHVLLHAPDADTAPGLPHCRGIGEVEAESVAYLVAAAHELDSSADSFAYIAGWAHAAADSPQAMQELISLTATRVLEAAHTILDATQPQQSGEAAEEERSAGIQVTSDRASRDARVDLEVTTTDADGAPLDRPSGGLALDGASGPGAQEALFAAFPREPTTRAGHPDTRPGRRPQHSRSSAGLER